MSGLSWRNKERENYIQIDNHVYAKKDDLDYFTEQDLIKRYADKRNIPTCVMRHPKSCYISQGDDKLTECFLLR